jgi:hypothetical protein
MPKKSTGYKIKYIKHNYFDISNIQQYPEIGVIIGFIAADGCISKRPKRQATLTIRLGKKDKIVLDIINKKIAKSTRPIWEDKLSFCLSFPSNEICNDLAQYGIVPRKTSTFTLPSIPEPLMSYFIRGYFYGDGCIHGSGSRRKYQFMGNTIFILQLKKYLENKAIDRANFYPIKKCKDYGYIEINGRQAAFLSDYMFANNKMKILPRKHIRTKHSNIKSTWWTKEETEMLIECKQYSEIKELCKKIERPYDAAKTKRLAITGKPLPYHNQSILEDEK